MKILPGVRFRFRALALTSFAALVALAAAGYGGSSATASQGSVAGAQHTTSSVVVKTRKVKGKVILVNAAGHTLYVFARDKQKRVTCTGQCASFWPPLKQKGTHKARAGGAAKSSLIGSDKNPSGGRVVTYSKWPLYTYTGDSGAGSANGEGQNLNGGRWYVMSPSGKVLKSLSATGGGGGWG
jgi:predicted lipoprotein with Yx(FWY)xxD motif